MDISVYYAFIVTILAGAGIAVHWLLRKQSSDKTAKPTSLISKSQNFVSDFAVNYHFTRECNYKCGFCFHTSLSKDKMKLGEAKEGLEKLVEAGMKKLNFAGGEPFLYPKFLGELCRFAKEELNIMVTIVSNGSKINDRWMAKYGGFVDMLAVSCDSFDEKVNDTIGRTENEKPATQLQIARTVAALCRRYGVKFKMNTVVNTFNWEEDMNAIIAELQPARWKVFQCLIIEGENSGAGAICNAHRFVINEDQFDAFIKRHQPNAHCLVREGNDEMRTSYLILDERMRFLDCSGKKKTPGPCILEIDIQEAIRLSGYEDDRFKGRGGDFFRKEWLQTAATTTPCSTNDTSIIDIEDM